jgi:glycosyltransferase involved in cell wall biosynthesis
MNIIISAYKAAPFIEQCLVSIQKQTSPVKKILVGIDGCQETLNSITEIMWRFPNLEVYSSNINQGPYLMRNALINMLGIQENFLIFDADDIMNQNMIELVEKRDRPSLMKYDGILSCSVKPFLEIGGYKPWRCGADTDIKYRLEKYLKIETLPRYRDKLFYRREHPNQLTKNPETNISSPLRRRYVNQIKNDLENGIVIIPFTSSQIKKVNR